MLEVTMKRLIKAGEELEIQVQEYPEYSGRGMFGSMTCGVTLESSADLLPLVAKAANQLSGLIWLSSLMKWPICEQTVWGAASSSIRC